MERPLDVLARTMGFERLQPTKSDPIRDHVLALHICWTLFGTRSLSGDDTMLKRVRSHKSNPVLKSRQQLIIHSGAFKTATSAVQAILNENVDILLREHSTLIPRTFSRPLQGVDGVRSHNQLAHIVNKVRRGEDGAEDKLRSRLTTLAEEIRSSAADRAVISSEMLTEINESSARVIRDCLQEFDIRVVYSVRRVDEYLESLARQRLKFKNVTRKVSPPYETPFTGLVSWATVLGDAAIDALVYGYPSLDTAVTNTLAAFGIENPNTMLHANPVRNPSLQADGILLRRALTQFTTRTGHDVFSSGLREAIVRRAYRLEAGLERVKPLRIYTKKERLAIFDATLPVHEEISKRFLSPEQREIFLARSAIETLPDSSPARWTQAEVLAVVEELASFSLEHLSGYRSDDHAMESLRRQFRIARKRNAHFRDRIKELQARLAVDTSRKKGP